VCGEGEEYMRSMIFCRNKSGIQYFDMGGICRINSF